MKQKVSFPLVITLVVLCGVLLVIVVLQGSIISVSNSPGTISYIGEVILITDKTEYEKDSEINITITNNFKKSIWYPFGNYTNNFALFGYNSSDWSQVPVLLFILLPGYTPEIIELKSGESITLKYTPSNWIDNYSLNFERYKLTFYYKQNKDSGEPISIDSNEFIIK